MDRIFEKLTLTYGQVFLRRWADVDLAAVKADWAHELDGFERFPKAIAWGLQNLPEADPPTVLQFRALCRKAPAEDVPRLEEPRAAPERVAAELAKLAPLRQPGASEAAWPDVRWAHRLIERHNDGSHRATATTLKMATDAIARRAGA